MAEIFRQEAVETLHAPERLDARLKVLCPQNWIPIVAVGVLLTGALAWGILGRLSVSIEGRGILVRSGNVAELKASQAARIGRVLIEPGSTVRKDDVIAELEAVNDSQGSQPRTIVASRDGILLDSTLKPGWRIQEGDRIGVLGIEPESEAQLCLAYLKLNEGQLATIGLRAFVTPQVARSADIKAIEGRVVYVRAIPTDVDLVTVALGSSELAKQLTAEHRLSEVIIAIPGAKRRTPEGALIPIAQRTLADVKIEIERKQPAAFLFPFLFKTITSESR